MKTLIIHHVEPMWENGFDRESLLENIIKHIEKNDYNEIILTQLEGGNVQYEELAPYINRVEEWSYAWESTPEDCVKVFGGKEEDYIYAYGHEIAYVYPWIKNLRGDIDICGGGFGECLQDLMDTLNHLDKPYEKIMNCIY